MLLKTWDLFHSFIYANLYVFLIEIGAEELPAFQASLLRILPDTEFSAWPDLYRAGIIGQRPNPNLLTKVYPVDVAFG
jgi:hypothetical protein